MFTLRFDLRTPPFATVTHAEQYQAMLEMCRWGDERGIGMAVVSEHHGTEDGFMTSPMVLAAAILGATKNMSCMISALLTPFHDPIRIAEDMASLDNLAPGRLNVVAGLGYRRSEFDMFGRDRSKRGKDLDAALELILKAWSGEPFEVDGRQVWVNPKPATQPHPTLIVGGSVKASAKRAARFHLPFMPPLNDPELVALYMSESEANGHEHPMPIVPDGPGLVMVTEDPDRLWDQIGANLLYDAEVYAEWNNQDGERTGWKVNDLSIEGLKAGGQHAIVTPDECVKIMEQYGSVTLHPLCGGIDPAIGWESLQLVVDKVMPALPS